LWLRLAEVSCCQAEESKANAQGPNRTSEREKVCARSREKPAVTRDKPGFSQDIRVFCRDKSVTKRDAGENVEGFFNGIRAVGEPLSRLGQNDLKYETAGY
jgi:hypothetical protein